MKYLISLPFPTRHVFIFFAESNATWAWFLCALNEALSITLIIPQCT